MSHADSRISSIRDAARAKIAEERQEQLGDKFPVQPILGPSDCAPLDKWLSIQPPNQEWILEGIIARCVVGLLLAEGGIGNSLLSLLMAFLIAVGERLGPFNPATPNRVLMINVEDSETELWRRVYHLVSRYNLSHSAQETLKKNLLIYPGRGIVGPLMCFNGNNPSPSIWAEWLSESVRSCQPALLILDTKSRLYGLEENSNDHNAQWLRILEKISIENNCSVLVIHHNSKARGSDLSADSSRGGKALTDNARFVLNAAKLEEKEIKQFDLDQPEKYLKLMMTKSNYSAATPVWYFERGTAGVLHPANLQAQKLKGMVDTISEWLTVQEKDFTCRELTKDERASDLRKRLKESYGAGRKELECALDYGLKEGLFHTKNLGKQSLKGGDRVVIIGWTPMDKTPCPAIDRGQY